MCILFIVCIYIYKYIYMYVSVYVPVCVHIHPHTCNWREEAVFLHCLCGDLTRSSPSCTLRSISSSDEAKQKDIVHHSILVYVAKSFSSK